MKNNVVTRTLAPCPRYIPTDNCAKLIPGKGCPEGMRIGPSCLGLGIKDPDGIVLQKQRTLDEVLLSAVRTFRNGCNWRLVKEDTVWFLEWGCCGVHVNFLNGDEKLLFNWFCSDEPLTSNLRKLMVKLNTDGRYLNGNIKWITLDELLKRPPCKVCGGTGIKEVPNAEPRTGRECC